MNAGDISPFVYVTIGNKHNSMSTHRHNGAEPRQRHYSLVITNGNATVIGAAA